MLRDNKTPMRPFCARATNLAIFDLSALISCLALCQKGDRPQTRPRIFKNAPGDVIRQSTPSTAAVNKVGEYKAGSIASSVLSSAGSVCGRTHCCCGLSVIYTCLYPLHTPSIRHIPVVYAPSSHANETTPVSMLSPGHLVFLRHTYQKNRHNRRQN